LVQGEPAPREIIDAIDFVETCCQDVIDVIILARGGGSIEELWAFNNEQVARKIFNSSIPIIVGVGHETDTTIADYVADVRAATPTGAAEIVVPSITDIEKLLAILNYRMASAVQKKIEQKRHKIQRVQQLLVCYNPREELLAKQHILQKINLQLQQAITNKLVDVANSFTLFNQRLDDLNPLKIMGRGYSLVYKDEASNEASNEVKHQLVTSIKQVSKNDQLRIQLTDGMINCQVWGLKDGQEN
jgi:exodeoxyribonuclease VII large subunit